MAKLFSGTVNVHYGQFYLEAGTPFDGDMPRCFAKQSNGLCGAAVPGFVFLTTGLHTGPVGLDIESHESEPDLNDIWEDVVEVSLQVSGPVLSLVQWAELTGTPLVRMAGSYRLRYSGRGMDKAHEEDTVLGSDPIDRYRIDIWPASPAPDRVVKQTSDYAAYWHAWARDNAAG